MSKPNKRRKVSEKFFLAVKAADATGLYKIKQLANMFECSETTISRIKPFDKFVDFQNEHQSSHGKRINVITEDIYNDVHEAKKTSDLTGKEIAQLLEISEMSVSKALKFPSYEMMVDFNAEVSSYVKLGKKPPTHQQFVDKQLSGFTKQCVPKPPNCGTKPKESLDDVKTMVEECVNAAVGASFMKMEKYIKQTINDALQQQKTHNKKRKLFGRK